MCWVMPPASPLATSVSRIASSSEVLPWSTWPMIVTTGGRSSSSSSSSSKTGSPTSSSAAWTISISLPNSVGEHADRLVGERLRERRHLAEAHQLADHLGHRDAEVLGDVLDRRAGVDPDQVGRAARGLVDRRDGVVVGAAAAAAAPRRAAHRLRGGAAGLAARGLRVDHDAAAPAGADRAGALLAGARVARRARAVRLGGARRLARRDSAGSSAAPTRRLAAAAAALARRGLARLGAARRRGGAGAARLRRPCRGAAARPRRLRLASRLGRCGLARAWPARACPRRWRQRAERELLIDGRGGGLGLDPGGVQLREQLLGRRRPAPSRSRARVSLPSAHRFYGLCVDRHGSAKRALQAAAARARRRRQCVRADVGAATGQPLGAVDDERRRRAARGARARASAPAGRSRRSAAAAAASGRYDAGLRVRRRPRRRRPPSRAPGAPRGRSSASRAAPRSGSGGRCS